VPFQSCIRSPDTRRFVTGVVKYAENKLRARLKIRSKLNANEIGVEDKLLVDRYFGPEEVSASRGVSAEEPEYLKQYEAETTGFDFSAAHRIEADSWRNTSRLTGEALEIPVMEEDGLPDTEEMWVEGSLGTDALWPDRLTVPETASSETAAEPTDLRERGMAGSREDCSAEDSPTEAAAVPEQAHSVEKEAVAALLAGQYTAFCRERGLFPGRMAEQINEIFLELVGDILVEADGSRFQLIEDYREDAAAWSKT